MLSLLYNIPLVSKEILLEIKELGTWCRMVSTSSRAACLLIHAVECIAKGREDVLLPLGGEVCHHLCYSTVDRALEKEVCIFWRVMQERKQVYRLL